MRRIHRPLFAISLGVLIAVPLSATPASARRAELANADGPLHPDARGRQRHRHRRAAAGRPPGQKMGPGGRDREQDRRRRHRCDRRPSSAPRTTTSCCCRRARRSSAHPYLHDNLPYKPEDLAPIARVSNTFVGITVPVASPANSLNELVALVRAKPGELNWAGVTGANSFMFEAWLKSPASST